MIKILFICHGKSVKCHGKERGGRFAYIRGDNHLKKFAKKCHERSCGRIIGTLGMLGM